MTATQKTSIALTKLAYDRNELSDATCMSIDLIERAHHSGALKAKQTSPGSNRYRYLAADVQAWLESLPDG